MNRWRGGQESPLTPVIVDFFKEALEHKALEQAPLKRYVDNTHVVLQHGQTVLDDFIHALNSMYDSIQFTEEHEVDGKLPFLDILLK